MHIWPEYLYILQYITLYTRDACIYMYIYSVRPKSAMCKPLAL